jgi:transposase
MAKGYRPVDRDQPFLLPPDMREWLPAGHPVWLVIAAVEDHLDTSAFHARRRTGGAGTAGYDPDMLVTLLMWAYATGLTSSRRIEAACLQDVCFRVICAGNAPDHVTIARFRATFPGAAESLFREVLVLCARLGMGRLATIALDGTRIAANASKAANRGEETLRNLAAQEAAKAAAAHAATDEAEDELSGAGRRGDEVPPEAVNPATRAGRIAAALADLEAEREAQETARQAKGEEYMQAGGHQRGNVPAVVAVAAAAARLDRARAAQQARIVAWEQRMAARAAAGLGPPRGGNKPPHPVEDHRDVRAAREALAKAEARAAEAQRKASQEKKPERVRNITDPDSRLMPTRNGFIQGYNPQNMTSEDKLIIAEELTQDTTDGGWFETMLAAAQDAATLITAHQPAPAPAALPSPAAQASPSPAGQGSAIKLLLADAGYCSEYNLTIPGPDRLIAVGKHRDLEKTAREAAASPAPAGQDPPDGPVAAMAARLATEEGITAYRKRGHIAETPHGQIKHNMGIRRLTMRGKPKAAAEWTFTATVHNLLKAITTGHLTPATLAALPR